MLEAITAFLTSGGGSTVVGGFFGGLFRVIPEVIKLFDRKNERAHELAMQTWLYRQQQLAGQQKESQMQQQGQMEWNKGYLDALVTAIKGQGPTGVKWVDAINALVRPLITFQWVIVLYPTALVASFVLAVNGGADPLEALTQIFGPEEKAICAGIINFFFLNRIFDKARTR